MRSDVREVRGRRRRRSAPAVVVAAAGAANIVTGLFPAVGVELVEVVSSVTAGGSRGPLLTGRVAAVELGFVLLVVARGLSRGSRSAWLLAVAGTAMGGVVGLVDGRVTLTGVLSVVALAVLVATRGAYRLNRHGRLRTWWLPAGLAAALLAFAVVGYAEIDQLAPAPLATRLAVIGRTMLFLPGGVDREQAAVEAYAAALRVGLIAVLAALIWSLRSRARSTAGGRDDTRRFVCEHGTASTAPLLALPDNTLLSLCSGDALAAVGVSGGTAVCLGGPVAVRGQERDALAEFTAYCERAGWTPALLAADSAQREVAVAAGYTSLQIGVEAVLDVSTFSTAGKRRSNVRHSVSRARREGVSVIRYDRSARTHARTEQLAHVSAQWLADKGGPELGFTLGRFDPDRLDDQEVQVAVSGAGTDAERVVAFVTWLPYDGGRAAVLDLMRRAADCPPGVMELLVVDSVADFASRGRTRASLGGVPLAGTGEREGTAQRLLGWLYVHGGTVYDARGLFRFKDKFDPEWEPMWLLYPGRADLPRITLAAARAFLPPGVVREALRARRSTPAPAPAAAPR